MCIGEPNLPSTRYDLLCYFYMYGGFADAKFPGGRADGCSIFDDVRRQFTGAFLDISFQILTLPLPFCHKIYMWPERVPCLYALEIPRIFPLLFDLNIYPKGGICYCG